MRELVTMSRFTSLVITCGSWSAAACSLSAQQPAPPSHNEVLIKNAVVMTVTHGNIQNGSVYIKDGKIAAVGKDVNAPVERHRDRCGRQISDAGHHRLPLAHCAGRRRERGHQPGHAADDDDGRLRLSGQGHLSRAGRRRHHFAAAARVGQHDWRAGGRDQAQVRSQPRRHAVSRRAALHQVRQR